MKIADLQLTVADLARQLQSILANSQGQREPPGQEGAEDALPNGVVPLLAAKDAPRSFASAVSGSDSTGASQSSNPHVKTGRNSDTETDAQRKSNVIIFGVDECPNGTPWYKRAKSDLESVTNVLIEIDDDLQKHSIKDCSRLGHFKENLVKPRPIKVELVRAADASNILANRKSLRPSITIKPDLSPQARANEALLLKERWTLIQSGTERKHIKIRNLKIFVNGKLHGHVENKQFRQNSPGDDVPGLVNPVPDSDGDNAGNDLSTPPATNQPPAASHPPNQ